MRVITSFDELDPVPWANGAGETTELVSLADSETLTPALLRWRLSIARLDHPAAFSALPGLERTFLPIGAEAVLDIDGNVRRVTPAEPERFRGEANVSLIELDAPCFALNLMVEDSTGAGSKRRALTMTTRSTSPGLFALTLKSVPGHPRFQLLHLDEADTLPHQFETAVLH